jgi:sugar/nucleoside kinase (ribokinase family)
MLDVLGIGTNSLDEVVQLAAELPAIVSIGKARMTNRHVMVGGQTATVAAGCAALGLRAGYIGAFGADAHGELVRSTLHARGVDLTYAVVADAPNRGALVLVDACGRRAVLWRRSERLAVPLSALSPQSIAARLVHVDDDDAALALHAARLARAANIHVTSDIEHAVDGVEAIVAAVTCPIFDEHLPAQLTGERDPERALRKLRRLNRGLLVMTLADRGAAALEGDVFHTVPACPVRVVDSTGAGDVFRAGFIYGVLQGWAVPEILRFANAAAAVCCTRLGAVPSVPSLADVLRQPSS